MSAKFPRGGGANPFSAIRLLVHSTLSIFHIVFFFFLDEAMKFMIDHILKLPTENQQPQDHIKLPEPHTHSSGSLYDESFETEDPPDKSKGCCS